MSERGAPVPVIVPLVSVDVIQLRRLSLIVPTVSVNVIELRRLSVNDKLQSLGASSVKDELPSLTVPTVSVDVRRISFGSGRLKQH